MYRPRFRSRRWFRALFTRRMLFACSILLQILFLIYVILDRSRISHILSGSLRVISLAVALYIVSKRDKGAFKLTWVFLILIFPLFGGLTYLLFHLQTEMSPLRSGASRIEGKTRALSLLAGDDFPASAIALERDLASVRYLQSYAGFPIYGDTECIYFKSGEEMWERLLDELARAEKYIFLEYFIIQQGVMWDAILEILKQKASQGVTVRIIYDDFGCFFKLPYDYAQTLKHHGIDCAIFNPFRPIFSVHQNNRDHRKIAVIDGEVAFTGGVNLADEYINVTHPHGHWKDSAVMLRGKGAWSLTLMFLSCWESCVKRDEDYAGFFPSSPRRRPRTARGFVQPWCDSPMDRDNVGEHVYLHIIQSAREYLYITTPYLIIDDSMISALTLAAKSGVDVQIITPHIGDNRWVHMTTRSYYRELIRSGVKIYEYEKGFIHAKSFVSDDHTATVGTTNLDFRSLYMHFECGVRLYDCPAVLEVKEDFLKTRELSRQIREKEFGRRPFLHLIQDLLRLFAPLM